MSDTSAVIVGLLCVFFAGFVFGWAACFELLKWLYKRGAIKPREEL